ncbi:PF10005 domain protein [Bacteriovorax sp. BAL6_X]|uniref:putative zinc-binding metallopeptidase n=1 Tax=Bacteriovorax sp. BAL6_X TaxID=1201290 RepID=UPI000386DD45|nr:putative zinc-binding metallopeptidase [Bacteriovorax sp. BAL6_X]EPZ51768.1 PF10005 domain protein [Bacteriovorax sp. BAL6_X]
MIKLNLEYASREDILNAQLWELDICFEKSKFAHCLDQLVHELDAKKLLVRPKVWLSDEWFCPEAISGIAIPFSLMHPKLIELEKEFTGLCEGEDHDWFMKLMRHECGHVMDNAYFLKDEKKRKNIFGDHDRSYPSSYGPRKFSKKYVYHLEDNYAQAHPEEDFAETFSVWLTPRSNWKRIYESWPALKKLNYVDHLMKSLSNKKPNVVCYKEVDSIDESELTVREYLLKKKRKLRKTSQARRSIQHIQQYLSKNETTGIALDKIIGSLRKDLVRDISLLTKEYQYKIESVVNDLEGISNKKKLMIPEKCGPQIIHEIVLSHADKYFKEGRDRIVM